MKNRYRLAADGYNFDGLLTRVAEIIQLTIQQVLDIYVPPSTAREAEKMLGGCIYETTGGGAGGTYIKYKINLLFQADRSLPGTIWICTGSGINTQPDGGGGWSWSHSRSAIFSLELRLC